MRLTIFLIFEALDGGLDEFSMFETLVGGFLAHIDRSSTNFSHVKRARNIPTHLLIRVALNSDVSLECTRIIPYYVSQAILLDLNNI